MRVAALSGQHGAGGAGAAGARLVPEQAVDDEGEDLVGVAHHVEGPARQNDSEGEGEGVYSRDTGRGNSRGGHNEGGGDCKGPRDSAQGKQWGGVKLLRGGSARWFSRRDRVGGGRGDDVAEMLSRQRKPRKEMAVPQMHCRRPALSALSLLSYRRFNSPRGDQGSRMQNDNTTTNS